MSLRVCGSQNLQSLREVTSDPDYHSVHPLSVFVCNVTLSEFVVKVTHSQSRRVIRRSLDLIVLHSPSLYSVHRILIVDIPSICVTKF